MSNKHLESYPIIFSCNNNTITTISIKPKFEDMYNYISNNSLYINSKNVRTIIGGKTPIEQMDLLFESMSLHRNEGSLQYSFRSDNELWFVFVDDNKINDYLKNVDENIKTIYLVNDDNEFSTKLKVPSLNKLKEEDGTNFKLNHKFDVKNNKVILNDIINISF